MPLRARRYIAIAAGQEKQVTNWLGKFWPLRLALWLFAAALCLLVWPAWISEICSRRRLSSNESYELDGHAEFGNLVFLKIGDLAIEAWDWKANKRWRVESQLKPSHNYVALLRKGGDYAIAAIDDDHHILVTEGTSPYRRQVLHMPVALSHCQPLIIDDQTKFAAVAKYDPDGNKLHVVELATGHLVDSKTDGDRVFLVGNGDLELVDLDLSASPSNPPFVKSTRWRMTDEGKLIPSQVPPAMDAEIYSLLNAHRTRFVSPDGRFAIVVDRIRTEIREQSTGRVLEQIQIPPMLGLYHVAFSHDGKHLLVGDVNTNYRVFDLETQALVANDHYLERRHWFAGVLVAASLGGMLLAIALAVSSLSFERAVWDYLLATVFWDSFVTAMGFQYEWYPGYTGSATVMAAGIYWALGKQSFWVRFVCCVAAIAVTGCTFWSVVARSDMTFAYEGIFSSMIFFPVVSAAAAWLMTIPFNWRIAREETVEPSPRFQLRLGTICFWIAVAAILLATMRFAATKNSRDSEIEALGKVAGYASFMSLFGAVVTWLAVWLWFRSLTWLSWAFVCFVPLGIAGLAFQSLVDSRVIDLSDEINFVRLPGQVLLATVPFVVIFTRLSFPLWLARRHGYHWVKVSKAAPEKLGAAV